MTASLWRASLGLRCPACGKGKLYAGVLKVRDRCDHCQLLLAEHEKGDGPAVFVILIVGFFVTALAGIVEVYFKPPYWVHALLWVPLIFAMSIWLLRVCKAAIIALGYKYRG